MNRPVLDIVIVDYDSRNLLRECIESIAANPPRFLFIGRIVVVDNASLEPSINNIEELNIPVHVIRNSINRGFAAACNQGARYSTAKYLLFLNPDTRLTNNSLDGPALYMEEANNKDVGIVGIQLIGEQGIINPTCRQFPKPSHYWNKALCLNHVSKTKFQTGDITDWNHRDTRQVDQVMGAFFFVRREVFKTIGGFDERFFVYFEEVDFSLRALRAGWRSIFLSDAQAFHLGCGTTDKVKSNRLYYSLRSRILYGYKHFNLLSATLVLLVTFFVEPVSRITWAMVKTGWRDVVQTVLAYAMLWGALPEMLLNVIRSYRSTSTG